MKKNEVKVGGTYLAKVTDKVVQVRLDAEHPRGGWQATNLSTKKQIRIKSAQRLRGPAKPAAKTTTIDAGGGVMVDVAERTSESTTPDPAKLTVHVAHDRKDDKWFWSVREDKVEHHVGAEAFDSDESAKAAGDQWLASYAKANDAKRRKLLGWKPTAATPKDAKATKPARQPKAPKEGKKLSLINAAAQVLADAKEPMNVKQMLERVVELGLWTPGSGRTPSSTLYAAILRETGTKGAQARFEKVDRGHFRLTDAGRQSVKGA
ncbi:MAG: hypothetical protein GMKNLPBB_02902 [Myxococcota bacterium]|nr:hypothetical protein [Myxococcota bacterium]